MMHELEENVNMYLIPGRKIRKHLNIKRVLWSLVTIMLKTIKELNQRLDKSWLYRSYVHRKWHLSGVCLLLLLIRLGLVKSKNWPQPPDWQRVCTQNTEHSIVKPSILNRDQISVSQTYLHYPRRSVCPPFIMVR